MTVETDNNNNGGNSGATKDSKPTPDRSIYINLKVKNQDGNDSFYRTKRTTALMKLMEVYCRRESVDMESIAFLFDGRRLHGDQTANELEMEDGDEIDAMWHQTGGY